MLITQKKTTTHDNYTSKYNPALFLDVRAVSVSCTAFFCEQLSVANHNALRYGIIIIIERVRQHGISGERRDPGMKVLQF